METKELEMDNENEQNTTYVVVLSGRVEPEYAKRKRLDRVDMTWVMLFDAANKDAAKELALTHVLTHRNVRMDSSGELVPIIPGTVEAVSAAPYQRPAKPTTKQPERGYL